MGARPLQDMLRSEGLPVGRRRAATLMRKVAIEPLYRRPNTSRKHLAHPVYPYLLRGLIIDRPNQVWALDITYVPMAKGFVYLCVLLDWASRKLLAHRLSISLDAGFCVEALEDAGERRGLPEIVNTHQQGCRVSRAAFLEILTSRTRISMDAKGAPD